MNLSGSLITLPSPDSRYQKSRKPIRTMIIHEKIGPTVLKSDLWFYYCGPPRTRVKIIDIVRGVLIAPIIEIIENYGRDENEKRFKCAVNEKLVDIRTKFSPLVDRTNNFRCNIPYATHVNHIN